MQKRGMIVARQELCIGCARCIQACPTGSIALHYGKAYIDPVKCVGCEQCVSVCPTGAIERLPESVDTIWLRIQHLRWQTQMLSNAVNRASNRTPR
jgi:ferredoxin